MESVTNLLFVVAGSFLSGYSSLVLERLPRARRLALGAAGLAGFALVVSQVPFRGDFIAALASGGYAALAGGHVALQVLDARSSLETKEVRTVAIWTTASVAVMAALLWWVAGAAPSA